MVRERGRVIVFGRDRVGGVNVGRGVCDAALIAWRMDGGLNMLIYKLLGIEKEGGRKR